MEPRVFQAFTIQDAMKIVKKELGEDAVILSTREKMITMGGRTKPTKVVEVKAAGSTIELKAKLPTPPKSRVMNADLAQKLPKYDFRKQSYEQNLKEKVQRNLPPLESIEHTLPARSHAEVKSQQLENDNIARLSQEVEKFRQELYSMPSLNLHNEVQEIKMMLHDLLKEKYRSHQDENHAFITDINIKLRAAGVAESIISNLSQMVSCLELPTDSTGSPIKDESLREFYLKNFVRILLKNIKVTGEFRQQTEEQKLLAVIGPTGVGKTTTLAKIGATLKLKHNAKIAFISFDTFRVAAVDQLRVFARILDCPMREATEAEDLVEFISKQSDVDYILIDTAGKNIRQDVQSSQLHKLKECPLPISFHLALSTTMKQRDLTENINSYREFNPASLIFTKLDESWSYGEILNSSLLGKVPISYFTTGQRVPEDLEVATKEKIVEKLFKL